MIDDRSLEGESNKETNGIKMKQDSDKNSAAEAFGRLEKVIWKVHDKIESLGGQIQSEGNGVDDNVDAYQLEGKLSLLDSIFSIHDQLYKRVVSMEAGEWAPDSFIIDLLNHIENELERHEVHIIRPELGVVLDLKYMYTQKGVPAQFWRKSNTVAKVHSCGFATKIRGVEKILKMAVVDVYRNKKAVPKEN